MSTGGQQSNGSGGNGAGAWLGLVASIIALLGWFGISNFHSLENALNGSSSNSVPSQFPEKSVGPAPSDDPECSQAADTNNAGINAINSELNKVPGSAPASSLQDALQSAAAQANTTSNDLSNEAGEASNPQVQTIIRNLSSDWSAYSSAIASNSNLDAQSSQIDSDVNELNRVCQLG